MKISQNEFPGFVYFRLIVHKLFFTGLIEIELFIASVAFTFDATHLHNHPTQYLYTLKEHNVAGKCLGG